MEFLQEHTARFGYLFYLASPNATSYGSPEEVPDYVRAVAPQFAVLLVLELVVLWLQEKPLPPLNDMMTSVGHGFIYTTTNALTKGVELVGYQWLYERRLFSQDWSSPVTWWIAAIGVDFSYYWVHRAVHEVSLGWTSHQVHHSSEHYNLSTALRQSCLQKFFSFGFYLPLAVIGVPMSALLVHLQFNLLYQFWIHTEAVSTLGPLEYVLNTASHHRVHHGSNHWCIDKNYAGFLIIWDRMFGTFQPELYDEPIMYGLIDQPQTFNIPYLQTFYLRDTLERAWAQKNWTNTVFSLIKGPGWTEGSPRLGHPFPKKPTKIREKYNPTLPFLVEAYLLAHFLVCFAIQQVLMYNYANFSWTAALAQIVFLIVSIGNIGAMYDGRWYAGPLEVLRCGAFAAVTASHDLTPQPLLNCVVWYYAVVSVVIWTVHCVLHCVSSDATKTNCVTSKATKENCITSKATKAKKKNK